MCSRKSVRMCFRLSVCKDVVSTDCKDLVSNEPKDVFSTEPKSVILEGRKKCFRRDVEMSNLCILKYCTEVLFPG